MAFELLRLPYAADSLEPYIDSRTMDIHYGKHYTGYTNKLNAAIEGTDLDGKPIEDILKIAHTQSDAVRNNAGGYYNHTLFWEILSPNGGGAPTGDLKKLIDSSFGDFETLKDKFSKAAATRFGSGWAWLCVKDGKLEVCSTANQDNPLMGDGCGGVPILGLDVWEHAYYLHYQNRRPDYIEAFWNVVNWSEVHKKCEEAM